VTANLGTRRTTLPWFDWARHLSFQVKLGLMVNLLILVLIAGSLFLMERRQRTAIVQEVEKRALIMAQALESATTADLLTYNYVSIEQSVLKFSKEPDLVYAEVMDKEGGVAAEYIRDYPIRRILTGSTRPKTSVPTIDQLSLPGTERETVYDVRLPVMIEGSPEPWGTIRLGVSLKRMHAEIARSRWQIAGFGLVGLVLGSAAATLLARRMTRPIQALTRGVAAVGRGDFSQQIEVVSQDELGQLSSAFNEMTQQLARIRELEDRLRRADRLAALGTMAAGIAHDIRNPLTSILIFSQLMSSHHNDPEVREKFDRVVPRELERVQAVIEDMMELARPSTMHLEPASVNEILTQVFELYEEQAATQGVKIAREFDPTLPFCLTDRKRLHRCLSNLISNAIQAMANGGDLAVRTCLVPTPAGVASLAGDAAPDSAIQISVSDTGPGIPADRLSRIFDPFYTTKEKGLGLGMAIAHRIIEDHKGTIDVESQVGIGTSFTVHLPVSLSIAPIASRTACLHTSSATRIPS
jgi:signal transduction histidine kinase